MTDYAKDPLLMIRCVGGPQGCSDVILLTAKELTSKDIVQLLYDKREWYLSVASLVPEPKKPEDFAMAPLCTPCAEKVQDPDVLKTLRDRLAKKSQK